MKCIALKELPQGHEPGDAFECNEDEFAVLELVGAAKRACGDDHTDDTPVTPSRRGYRRRDMQAEPSAA